MTLSPPPQPDPSVASPASIAVADLAERLGVEPAVIEVIGVDEVTWRDGSLGCPDPGMNYTHALVPGLRIVLRVAGVDHEYHAGRRRGPFYCPPDRIQRVAPGSDPSI